MHISWRQLILLHFTILHHAQVATPCTPISHLQITSLCFIHLTLYVPCFICTLLQLNSPHFTLFDHTLLQAAHVTSTKLTLPPLHDHLTFLSSLYLTSSTQVTFIYLISLDLTLTHFFRRVEYCFIRPYLFQPMSLHLTPLLSPWLYFTVACPVSSPNLPHLCLTLHHFPSSRFNLFTLIHSCYLILSHFTPTPSSSP